MNSAFLAAVRERVLVFDGAMGTSVHARNLTLDDYAGLENCTEILVQTRPDVIRDIHRSFLAVGCDAVETNTFGANKVVLAEFGQADQVYALNRTAAEIGRQTAGEFTTSDWPRFVAGSIGPGTKLVSLGQTTWDILEDSYAEQVRGLLDGGVDLLLIETCQDILQSKTAIAGAERAFQERNLRVPIIVQVTVETTGTMLVGTDMAAAVTALEAYPQVVGIGLNCATGPQEMSEHVRYLSRNCSRLLSVLPNAGLPQVVNGLPHYPLTPAELARWLLEFVEVDGVNIVGGCCGTTPEHLAAVVRAVGRRAPNRRSPNVEPAVSSLYQACPIRQDNSFLVIGERTNANGSRKFRRLLQEEDLDGMVEMAREQVREGSHVLDVCTAYVGRDELSDMRKVIARFATEVPVPLMIDSTEPPAIEAALKVLGGRCIINSINLEDGEARMAAVCPMARKYGAAVVALTIDEEGMAKTADRKTQIACRIHELATRKYGLRSADLIFDPLTFTICTGNQEDRRLGLETLEAIRRIKTELPECHTLLGLSNISFGIHPAARAVLNSVYLHHARECGLDAAIVHAAGIVPLYKTDERHRQVARDLIFDERRDGYDPLQELIRLFAGVSDVRQEAKQPADTVEERLKDRIVDGNRKGLEADLDEAMRTHSPLEIINTILLEGMKVVGNLFATGQMQLPFVLQSAETMKTAVACLEPHMEKAADIGKGSMVLATVKGDVHDIGKNLVDIILTNNGFIVYNLGIKQPVNAIIDAWQQHQADAIGMSGLLVKSTVVMRENLQVLNERGLTPPVILGGAALTRRYVEEDLRKIYKGPLFYAKDAFQGLELMQTLAEGLLSGPPAPAVSRNNLSEAPSGIVPGVRPRSNVRACDEIPSPPFWGSRVVESIPLRAVLAYINEVMLFQMQWQYRKQGRPAQEFERFIETEVRGLYRDLVEQCEREMILQPRAVYGYWPAGSEADDLVLFDPQDHRREAMRFRFPRQKQPPHWCLSDFFRSVESDRRDVVAFFIVTVGPNAGEVARQWFEQNRYRDYLHLHGLGVESAEATAEYMHKQIRMELTISDQDAREVRQIFQQGYRGSRYSFGYPACPNLEDQARLWPLLQPDRIGVSLSEEFQLEPEQSVSALVCHHPEARYFRA